MERGETIGQYPSRYFAFGGEGEPLFVWMQTSGQDVEWDKIKGMASAAALSSKLPEIGGILIEVGLGGIYEKAQYFKVYAPSEKNVENSNIFDEAERMTLRVNKLKHKKRENKLESISKKKIGRNELCPCGGGKKYKKCHGR